MSGINICPIDPPAMAIPLPEENFRLLNYDY
jgi:hypothetical protein